MADIQSIALRGLNNAVGRITTATSAIARAGTDLPAAGTSKMASITAGAVFQQNGLNTQQLNGVSDNDLASAAVDLKLGQAAYEANAAVIRAQRELERDFIRDIRI